MAYFQAHPVNTFNSRRKTPCAQDFFRCSLLAFSSHFPPLFSSRIAFDPPSCVCVCMFFISTPIYLFFFCFYPVRIFFY